MTELQPGWLNLVSYWFSSLKIIIIIYYLFDLNSTSTENTNKATMKKKKTITETTTLQNIKSKQKKTNKWKINK